MKIKNIEVRRRTHRLKTAFRTALRTVTSVDLISVALKTEDGRIGWGEAVPTIPLTGETATGIAAAIEEVLAPALIGMELLDYEQVFHRLHQAMVGNTSAKAALEMACYDCLSQHAGLSLFQYLGGYRRELETDYTVSVAGEEEMVNAAQQLVAAGFSILKIKVGSGDVATDLQKIKGIYEAVGPHILLRIDVNQGWRVKEAIHAIRTLEDWGLPLDLVEQPVQAHDMAGLKQVKDAVDTPIMADESLFSPRDALRLLQRDAVDLFNIKLMKSGGISQAERIYHLAASAGGECMVGSMIESRLGVTAAAHFAASKKGITRVDFDAPLMLLDDATCGGIQYRGGTIQLPASVGLGASLPQ